MDLAHRAVLDGVAALLLAGIAIIAAADRCGAATVRRAWIEHRGMVYTIHLEVGGRPRWVLGQQDNRLQIDLLNTNSNLSSRQFLQAAIGPLGMVRISGAPNQRMRIEISASGKCDFLVGRKRNQLMVSLAPAGANLNLAEAFTRGRATAAPRVRQAERAAPRVHPAERAATAAKPGAAAVQISQAPAPSALPVPPMPVDDALPPPIAPPPAMAERTDQGRPTVVVDAGHGGHDPGTRSEDGLLEKDLALQIARRVADALYRRGVNAVLTRDRDMFLTLAQRTAIANRLSPELFVSIHLNWSPNPQTTGVEVYYLNNTTDRATIRLARMENAADGGRAPLDPGLNYILSDLRQQYKATESALLAQTMEQQTVSELQAGFGGEIRGLGAKRGPFYVLVGPRIPAVLVECGFLSNAQEAQRLASAAYQQAIADGLATSVVHYLNQDVTAGTL